MRASLTLTLNAPLVVGGAAVADDVADAVEVVVVAAAVVVIVNVGIDVGIGAAVVPVVPAAGSVAVVTVDFTKPAAVNEPMLTDGDAGACVWLLLRPERRGDDMANVLGIVVDVVGVVDVVIVVGETLIDDGDAITFAEDAGAFETDAAVDEADDNGDALPMCSVGCDCGDCLSAASVPAKRKCSGDVGQFLTTSSMMSSMVDRDPSRSMRRRDFRMAAAAAAAADMSMSDGADGSTAAKTAFGEWWANVDGGGVGEGNAEGNSGGVCGVCGVCGDTTGGLWTTLATWATSTEIGFTLAYMIVDGDDVAGAEVGT